MGKERGRRHGNQRLAREQEVRSVLRSWPVRVGLSLGVALILSSLPYLVLNQESEQKLSLMSEELLRIETVRDAYRQEVAERRRFVQALKHDTRVIETIARDTLQMLYPHEKTLQLQYSTIKLDEQ